MNAIRSIFGLKKSKKSKNDQKFDNFLQQKALHEQAARNTNCGTRLKSSGYQEPTAPIKQRKYCKSMPDRDLEVKYQESVRSFDDTDSPRKERNRQREPQPGNSILRKRGYSMYNGMDRVHEEEHSQHKMVTIQEDPRDAWRRHRNEQEERQIGRAIRYENRLKEAKEINLEKDAEIQQLRQMLRRQQISEQLLRRQLDDTENELQQKHQQFLNHQMPHQPYCQPFTHPYSGYAGSSVMSNSYSMAPPSSNFNSYGGTGFTGNGAPWSNGYKYPYQQMREREYQDITPTARTPVNQLYTDINKMPGEAADTPSSMAIHEHEQKPIRQNVQRTLHPMFGENKENREDKLIENLVQQKTSSLNSDESASELNCKLDDQIDDIKTF